MNNRNLHIGPENWPLKEPFHISRCIKTEAQVIVAEVEHGDYVGHGESVPYARYGESMQSVISQIEDVLDNIESGVNKGDVQALLPAGAARNVIDCALWDLHAKTQGKSVSDLLNLPQPEKVETAVTIGISTAESMAKKAREYKDYPLLKIKLDKDNIEAKIKAIRKEAPNPRIIIDPNESWGIEELERLDSFFAEMKIDLLEQPLPAGNDDALTSFAGSIPICADEACHTREDLPNLIGKYQVINIKLDKTGGLTEAIELKKKAEEMGFEIMIGCMVSTSLGMAPALLLAHDATFVDLDGPLWMKDDRETGLTYQNGFIKCLPRGLWGGASS